MLDLEQVRKGLEDYNIKKVSDQVGIHYNTILGIYRRENPSYETIKKLSDYLENKDVRAKS